VGASNVELKGAARGDFWISQGAKKSDEALQIQGPVVLLKLLKPHFYKPRGNVEQKARYRWGVACVQDRNDEKVSVNERC
jgi:hypothetical protein